MARRQLISEVFNVRVVKQGKQKINPLILVIYVHQGHMQLPKQKYAFTVLLDIHKLKKVKQGVLNVYLEESIITKVTKIALNVL